MSNGNILVYAKGCRSMSYMTNRWLYEGNVGDASVVNWHLSGWGGC
jgi:hypothetical protein